jgi:hypothetical protein
MALPPKYLAIHARQPAPRLAEGRTGSSTPVASAGTSSSTCGENTSVDQETGHITHAQRDLVSAMVAKFVEERDSPSGFLKDYVPEKRSHMNELQP